MSVVRRAGVLVGVVAVTLSLSQAAVAAAPDPGDALTDDWILLAVTGEPTDDLREYARSFVGVQTPDEFDAIADGPGYFLALPDGSAVGVPFPEGTSTPELMESGLLDANGMPTSALIERLADNPEAAAAAAAAQPVPSSSTSSEFGPLALTVAGCIGTSQAKINRLLAGKVYCEGWSGTGELTINRNQVRTYSTGSLYGHIRYHYVSESTWHHQYPGPWAVWDYYAMGENIYINTLERCTSAC